MKLRIQSRRQCWRLGAFTSNDLYDFGLTHSIRRRDSAENEVKTTESGFGQCVVDKSWLQICYDKNEYVDEAAFLLPHSQEIKLDPPIAQTTRMISQLKSDSETIIQIGRPERARIAYRRSDVSTVPLKPDGVFKGFSLSLYGWSDHRLESALIHQVTSNGGTIVPLNSPVHFACLCADGAYPISSSQRIPLVSQRWLNECLASGRVLDPSCKVIFSPSAAQLPLLLTRRVCIYISEKDQDKLDVIAELAKICGIKYVTRGDTRIPLSAVTHFVFFDLVSANRRRDLFPLAEKANKFVVSFDWLVGTYKAGTIQSEASFDLSISMNHAALVDSSEYNAIGKSEPLNDVIIVGDSTHQHLQTLVTQLGAQLVQDTPEKLGHICDKRRMYLTTRPQDCTCPVIAESWILECERQKRFITFDEPLGNGTAAPQDLTKENIGIQWENSRMTHLKNDPGSL